MKKSPARDGAFAHFCRRIGRLKTTPRTGWIDRGVPLENVESVADHSFRTAAIAWLAAANAPELDRDRVLKLALVHDFAEALTGDSPPYDPEEMESLSDRDRLEALNERHVRSDEDRTAKLASEAAAMSELTAGLEPGISEELMELWQELSERTTPEAKFVKQADILETWLQSREYMEEYPGLPVKSFGLEAEDEIVDDRLRAVFRALNQER